MPRYIVTRSVHGTPDGSRMGDTQVMITAATEQEAKAQGAEQLGCLPAQVTATPYGDPWALLRQSLQ